ncbi:hypothetical protein [Marinagarivorans algicola]|uniref:hypothetical protein n=1 Tax=Marinagarivorans algicola TaxID=1513270 RepID=UPI0006B8A9BC|nr:hypothetical protein [Marinagarivorans algicola]
MRFTSLTLLLSAFLLSACGSDSSNNNDDASSSSSSAQSSTPSITNGEPNDVAYAPNEFLHAFTFVDDEANNRWLIADTTQGVIAVDKTSKAVTILTPLANDDNTSPLQSINDLVLDTQNNTLYMLDLSGEQIVSTDALSGMTSVVAKKEDFSVEEGFDWGKPSSLFFDQANERLLIADAFGLKYVVTNDEGDEIALTGLSTFIYTPNTGAISVMAAANTLANPLAPNIEVKDIYFDSSQNTLYASSTLRIVNQSSDGSIATNYYYHMLKIDTLSQEASTIYTNTKSINNDQSAYNLADTSAHSLAYDSAGKQLFIVNNNKEIITLDIAQIEDEDSTVAESILRVLSSDDQDYPIAKASHIALNSAGELLVLDAKDSSLFILDYDITNKPEDDTSAARTLLVSGRPITPGYATRPQTIQDLGINPETQELLITDASAEQKNALTYSSMSKNFTPFALEVDISNVTPQILTLEEDQILNLELKPKPLFVAQEPTTGDLVILVSRFAQATSDEQVYNVYNFALYRRKAGATKALPISLVEDDNGNMRLHNFAFNVLDTQKIALSNDGVYFGGQNYIVRDRFNNAISIGDIVFWNEKEQGLETITNGSPYSPQNLRGLVYDATNKRILFIDAGQDALIAVAEDDERTFTVISGRANTDSPAMTLPSGLALNSETQTAYTFDNHVRAVISIDLATGKRTRIDSEPNYIRRASKISLSTDGQTLHIVDDSTSRIIALDLGSGEQRWIDQ